MRLLYAVYDKKADAFGPVMSYAHDAVAVRDFGQACLDANSSIHRYPADFQLECIGGYEDTKVSATAEPVVGCARRVVITADGFLAAQATGPQAVREA